MCKFIRRVMLMAGVSFAGVFSSYSVGYAAPPAKAFGELPLAYDADISPDGSQIAVIVNSDGIYYAATRQTNNPNEKLKAVSLGKDLRPRYIKWVNNERFMVSVESTSMDRGTPYTTTHLFTKGLGEKKGKFLITPKDFFRQFNDEVIDWLEDDPDHILMQYSNIAYDPFPDIYKVNVETGKGQRIQKQKVGIENWIVDESGKPRIGSGRTDGGNIRMKILDVKTDKWENHDKYPGLTPNTPIYLSLIHI